MKGKHNIKRIIIAIITIILSITAVFVIGLRMKLKKFSKDVDNIKINNVELFNIKDGVYIGEYYLNESVGAKVKIKVLNNRINDMEIIEHKCGLGKKAENITIDVKTAQSLNVDTVSGATASSKVILKAIENGLNKGIK